MTPGGDITRLLAAIRSGDSRAESDLMALVYRELHNLAASMMRSERPDHTLQPTALVNEAYVRLLRQHADTPHNRTHFFATAATVMRRVLVDYARQRRTAKRGAGRERVDLDEFLASTTPKLEELLIVDEMLTRMAEFAPKEARIVELTYFSGLTFKEAGEVLTPPVSERTAKRYQRDAHTWLKSQLRRARSDA